MGEKYGRNEVKPCWREGLFNKKMYIGHSDVREENERRGKEDLWRNLEEPQVGRGTANPEHTIKGMGVGY